MGLSLAGQWAQVSRRRPLRRDSVLDPDQAAQPLYLLCNGSLCPLTLSPTNPSLHKLFLISVMYFVPVMSHIP